MNYFIIFIELYFLMFETFYTLLLLCVAAAFVERILSKRDFSTKTLFILIGGLSIGMGLTFHVKEISDSGYQKVYQYVVADSFNEHKFQIAQDALQDNKITLKEMQAIMPSDSYGPIPSESQYLVKENFRVIGLPQVTPLEVTKQIEWADILHQARSLFSTLFSLAALLYFFGSVSQGAVHKYLNPTPVLFNTKLKFIYIFFTLSILTTAIMYLYPANFSSVQKVQQFVNSNKEIKEIQDLYARAGNGSNIQLNSLHQFKTIGEKVQTAQIKKAVVSEN